jgi:hypothetical protein
MYPNAQRMGETSIFRSRKEASSIGRPDDPSESMRDHPFDKIGKFAPSGRIIPGGLFREMPSLPSYGVRTTVVVGGAGAT